MDFPSSVLIAAGHAAGSSRVLQHKAVRLFGFSLSVVEGDGPATRLDE